jgi:hypothetical protein
LIQLDNTENLLFRDTLDLACELKEDKGPILAEMYNIVRSLLKKTKPKGETCLSIFGEKIVESLGSESLTHNFLNNSIRRSELEILYLLVDSCAFTIGSLDLDVPQMSETGQASLAAFKSFGWLSRFIQHRNT